MINLNLKSNVHIFVNFLISEINHLNRLQTNTQNLIGIYISANRRCKDFCASQIFQGGVVGLVGAKWQLSVRQGRKYSG